MQLTSLRNFASLVRRRQLYAVLIALILVTISQTTTSTSARLVPTEATVVLDTANATPLSGTFRLVNGEPGNQYSPQVDCDVATYSDNDSQGLYTIHYQNLAS